MWEHLVIIFGSDHALAGLVGAFGHQVVSIGDQIRKNNIDLQMRMVVISLFYILTGSGVGHFVGIDGGTAMIAAAAGFGWPTTVKSIGNARKIVAKAARMLGEEEEEEEEEEKEKEREKQERKQQQLDGVKTEEPAMEEEQDK